MVEGAWVARSVAPTLDRGSDHDLTVCEIKPCIRLRTHCLSITEPACGSLSPSLSAPPPLVCVHSLSQNKHEKNNKNGYNGRFFGMYSLPQFLEKDNIDQVMQTSTESSWQTSQTLSTSLISPKQNTTAPLDF